MREVDSSLIRQIKRGKYELFDVVIQEYQNPLFAFLYRMVRDADDARDLCQDTFFKAYKYIRSFKEEAKFSTWLFRIGYRLALNMIKRRKKHAESLENIDMGKDVEDSVKRLERKEAGLIVGRIMDEIHTNYRVALHLFYKEEKTYNEIATIMKIPENTVKSHIFRGKETIRKILAQKYPVKSLTF
ncbi:MAG: sigma-70 family RNA polymerase sigma factor [Candidatus Aminicenantes bacterium]|jgi:RNA polymerase sigma-70 factor (ECF subfamily)